MKKNNLTLAVMAALTYSSVALADVELVNGEPHVIASSETDDLKFNLAISESTAQLSVYFNANNGDGDLYITNDNGEAIDCKNEVSGSAEACVIKSPAAGTYSFELRPYEGKHFTNGTIVASTTLHPIVHECVGTIDETIVKIHNPELTDANVEEICATLLAAEALFHEKMATTTPVPNDKNGQVNVNIYANQASYMTTGQYAHNMRDDAETGIYFESTPESDYASADVITFEARLWAGHEFFIWELGHEYTHYLDGRYNKQGNYGTTSNHDLDWWTEGLAEYVSDNDSPYLMVKLVQSGERFSLIDIIESGYGGQASPYTWGATVVKYMTEQRPTDMQVLREKARVGDYDELDSWLVDWASNNQDDFDSWLDTTLLEQFKETAMPLELDDMLVTTSQHGKLYYIDVADGAEALSLKTELGGGNVDVYVAKDQIPNPYDENTNVCRSNKGALNGTNNDEICVVETPESGRYYVLLNAPGNSIFANAQVTAVDELLEVHDLGAYCDEETTYTKTSNSASISLLNSTDENITIHWLSHTTGVRSTKVYDTIANGETWTATWSQGDKFVAVTDEKICRAVGTLSSANNDLELTSDGLVEVVTTTPDPVTPEPVVEKKSSGGGGGSFGFIALSALALLRLFKR